MELNGDSGIHIACIIPNLEDHRETVSRIFTETFTDAGYYSLDSLALPFNISAGRSLANYPVIHTALQLLQLHKKTISIDTLSNILRSPFLADAEVEMLRRADFENQLRRSNIASIELKKLFEQHDLGTSCPSLAEKIHAYLEKIENIHSAKQSINKWIEEFIAILTLFGWPGERSINSEEYQVVQRFLELLTEYTAFDFVLPALSYQTALHYLIRITSNTVFQPQSPETPIQILGVLEAAEIPFDYVWMMGMDDTSWPPSPKPNPFIPQQLQKILNMPHATAEREHHFCKKITEQLKNCANTLIFSHALHNDIAETRVSALLEDIPEITALELELTEKIPATHVIYAHKKIELLQDDHAPPIVSTETITGGSKIFELQAACPFRAFAELRLFAKPIETITPGLRSIDRGNIVHKALEFIWKELKDSSTLHSQTNEALQKLIQTSIESAIYLVTGEETEKLQYLTLELQRLQNIITNWLELEKTRPPFQVLAQEQEYNFTIANISVNLRIDRIDALSENEKLIIDYKTGKNNQIHHWFGERPTAPQLPLYCLMDAEKSVGIAFATINAAKLELKGASKHNLKMQAVIPLAESKIGDALFWGEQITIWRQTLEKLGSDFCQGKANVDPKEGLQTCEYCKLKSFCRIYEKLHE